MDCGLPGRVHLAGSGTSHFAAVHPFEGGARRSGGRVPGDPVDAPPAI